MQRRLTASLAHNVNNALTGVIGYLELGRSQAGVDANLDAYLRSSLECAHRAADAVRRMVRCAGRVGTSDAPALTSLRRLVEDAVERLSYDPHSQTARITGSSPGQIHVSPSLMRRALDEMLTAMMDAATDGKLILRLADAEGRSALTFECAGSGSAELRDRLMEPSLLVEIQGGAAELHSAPGKGVCLTLSFPSHADAPIRRTDGPSVAPAPHLPAALGMSHCAI